MEWLLLASLSTLLLGFHDAFKEKALSGNSVVSMLFLSILFCSCIFLPFITLSTTTGVLDNTTFHISSGGWGVHRYILLKSCVILSSWIYGHFAMKHLPLTIVGPIDATRPTMVLVGAMLAPGEELNLYQRIGVLPAIASSYPLSRSGKKGGIDSGHDRWLFLLVFVALLGAVSDLYDKYLMAPVTAGGAGLDKVMVQGWYNVYQYFMTEAVLLLVWYPTHHRTIPSHWSWSIVSISVSLCMTDFVYSYVLGKPEAMVPIVSMVRRGSILASSLSGAFVFHEKNLKGKAVGSALMLLSMVFLFLGSKS